VRKILSVVPLVVALAVPGVARAQATREITGRVVQAGTAAPLADATVGIVGTPGGVRTNAAGEFRLRVPNTDVTLLARFIGFKRAEVRVPVSQSTANFTLEKDVLQLEGVTVTGAATTVEKRNAATAVSTVNAEELTRVPATSIESALQGKVVGASINMNNGAPGGGGQVQIRGASSLIGRIDPLYVVDGVIVSNAVRSNQQGVITGSLNSGEENGTNRLADINSNDIENIEILKGAAASAIYGSQATNGVVIITTKRGKAGAPRFGLTSRVSTSQLIESKGSRNFETLDELLDVAGNPDAVAMAEQVCTPNCPHYDYVKELYDRKDPGYEFIGNLSGGAGAGTRYFVSGTHKYEPGTAMNTDAKRQSLRANLDQAIGSRITAAISGSMMRSFSQRGIANNDNSFSSPLYNFGYTPAVFPFWEKDAAGKYTFNPFPPGGIAAASNVFQNFDLERNNEDVHRLITSGRVNYTAFSNASNTLTLTGQGGVDWFSNENYLLAPPELQSMQLGSNQAGDYPGFAIQGNGTNRLSNFGLSAIWNMFSGASINSTFSAGIQTGAVASNDYNLIGQGLTPTQSNAAGAQLTDVTQNRTSVINQAFYVQEDLLLLGEKLFVSGGVRGERSSVNGDVEKLYYFPRGQVSYRLANVIPFVSELKLRAAIGQSGNQPAYGERFIVQSNSFLLDGRPAVIQSPTIGNVDIRPERLTETEFGVDAALLNERVRAEVTVYDRSITDLLVRPALAPSSGVSTSVVNGGKLSTKGYEAALTVVPIQNRTLTWTSRNTWFQNRADIVSFPTGVNPFVLPTAARGFGNAYGYLRFTPGYTVSTIFGNKQINGVTTANQRVGDANPRYTMQFSNDFTFGNLALNFLVDYRHGGDVSNMTLNLFDEGANTWDYEKASPEDGVSLGEYRYNTWNGGRNTAVYIQDGSYTKVREINLTYQVPAKFYTRFNGVQSMSLNLSGRNLFIISGYNGYDPEVNNGGNFVSRFVDLAPWPPARSLFFSVDLGF
jgi:TonB-dependent starch-binding outer membrane protein SusC